MNIEPKYEEVFYNVLEYWKHKDFRSKDVSDILATAFYSKLVTVKNQKKWGKYVYYPFYLLSNRAPKLLRVLFSLDSDYKYPQAHALMIRALIALFRKNGDEEIKKLVYILSDELLELRNKEFENYCWGQPYNWPSKRVMKANVPRTTVTTQVAAAFLDIYEFFGDEKYLEYSRKICDFYIEDLNYEVDEDGDFCFSYTTEDNYKIHNPSILAASILYRVSYFNNSQKYVEYGIKAANFTAKNQNEDGSWHYRSNSDLAKNVIDNYHTGFVLEGFKDIETYSKGKFNFGVEMDKGIRFYVENFLTEGFEPKYRPDKVFPVDIQSCAQSIITLKMFENSDYVTPELIKGVLDYTVDHFYNTKGHFYYRYYSNTKVDKSSFLRWGDAWMLRALSL